MPEDSRSPEAQRIADAWGEPFAALAGHPRMEFGAEAIEVALWKPITVGGTVMAKLAIREPTLAQLQMLDRVPGEMAKTQRLLMQAAGLSEKEAGSLGIRDVTLCGLVLTAFTEAARATGA